MVRPDASHAINPECADSPRQGCSRGLRRKNAALLQPPTSSTFQQATTLHCCSNANCDVLLGDARLRVCRRAGVSSVAPPLMLRHLRF